MAIEAGRRLGIDRIFPFLVMGRCLTQEHEDSENVSYEKMENNPVSTLPSRAAGAADGSSRPTPRPRVVLAQAHEPGSS